MANILTDSGNAPLVNYNFLVRVDAIYDIPCKKISGITQEKEYETIQSGGENDYVYLREKPISKPFNFQIERYIGVQFFDPLPVGYKPELPILLYISRYINSFENPKWTFSFKGCTVVSKTYGELDAERSGLMLETTSISYQQVELIQSTNDEIMERKAFSF